MNCRDIDELLLERGGAERLPPPAAEHVRTCARCGELVAAVARTAQGAGTGPMPDAAVLDRIKTEIVSSLRPVKPIPSSGYFIGIFLAIFSMLAAAGTWRFGLAGLEQLGGPQQVALLALLAACGVALAISLARQMVPGRAQSFRPAAAMAAALLSLVAAIALLYRRFDASGFGYEGVACLRTGFIFAPPAAIAFWLVLRRGLVLAPVWAGASAGALAGMVGIVVLQMHCANHYFWHIMAWHVSVVILSAIAGSLLGVLGRLRLARPARPAL